ncbi:leucine--tRNA ligase [Synechococcus sp. C9]|uniref:leucine--tRNA ligase n=1 Tax=Synechococcus sp. C9 TaxID=102119 RepID=UPI001FF3C190|nr:leucine--tRNA ligase [Synechococcus sp. C9]
MTSPRYQPAELEPRWQNVWRERNLYKTSTNSEQPKYYALSMFPYPSGNLHMGHVRNYTITDVIARVRRMQGYRVLHPMGWDAFGLPAENAAIDRGIHPARWTERNIANMRRQLQSLGLSYDWEREFASCHPEYYRWTQWLFLQMWQMGLAYQKSAQVNWDPVDQTVLANEQVDSEGRSWRSGAKVQQKLLKQWFLRITHYAEELLRDLDTLTGWPERVKTMQANWIGRSTGAYLEFPVVGRGEKIGVFTTRPDTVFGVSYLVLAPEHPLVGTLTAPAQQAQVQEFCQQLAHLSAEERTANDQPKRGVPLGTQAVNPFTQQPVPIWIADYVLYEYGTGAVMGVPAHDERDFAFAQQYHLPITQVILPPGVVEITPLQQAYTEPGILVHSGEFDGLDSLTAKEKITQAAQERGWGEERVQYRLRDWLISRQRYWGVPIPMIHCDHCGVVPVPEADLPVLLPENVTLTGRGLSPLAQLTEWVQVPCPQCGRPARRETDTMDTFIDSSWYFLRFADAQNSQAIFASEKVNDWLPVDQYVGGIEHAILHLLYSRFITKVLRDRGLINFGEPFQRLLTQGMVQGLTYKTVQTGKYLTSEQVIYKNGECRDKETNEPVAIFYEKMSKSKYNGVDPEQVLAKYGADTARMFILFKAPPEKDLEWDDADVEGQFRFLQRVWRLVQNYREHPPKRVAESPPNERNLRRVIHQTIQAVTADTTGEYQFNTAIASLMKLTNELTDYQGDNSGIFDEGIRVLLTLLAPFAPHITEELWHQLGHEDSIHRQAWPQVDQQALVVDEITLVIQIMGKTRGTIIAPSQADQATLEQLAKNSDVGQRYLQGQTIKKVIYVPGKLLNFVLAS